jgi:putative phosphotransacetylase
VQANSKTFEKVRIVGPLREETQVEISKTDAVFLGVNPPINLSGDLKNSLPIRLVGPKGVIGLDKGLILAKRHIHCATDEAVSFGLKDGDSVSVKIDGERGLVFDNVVVRVKDDYKLAMHIDTDEGNAAGINKIGEGIILK